MSVRERNFHMDFGQGKESVRHEAFFFLEVLKRTLEELMLPWAKVPEML